MGAFSGGEAEPRVCLEVVKSGIGWFMALATSIRVGATRGKWEGLQMRSGEAGWAPLAALCFGGFDMLSTQELHGWCK